MPRSAPRSNLQTLAFLFARRLLCAGLLHFRAGAFPRCALGGCLLHRRALLFALRAGTDVLQELIEIVLAVVVVQLFARLDLALGVNEHAAFVNVRLAVRTA